MKKLLWLALVLLFTPALANPEQAESLIEDGHFDEARSMLENALQQESTQPQALILLTRLGNQTGDYAQAVEYGERAVELLPESADAHLEYARAIRIKMQNQSTVRAMWSIGRYKKQLRKALEIDPNHLEACYEQVGFLIRAPGIAGGSVSQARKKIESLKGLDWRQAMFFQAELEEKEENAEGAIAIYEQMLERDAADDGAREALAYALQRAERYRRADEHFRVLLEGENPRRSMNARYQLARSRVLGEYESEKAVQYLVSYIEKVAEPLRGSPSKSSAYWRLGMAYEQLGKLAEARRSYETAVDLDDNKQARTALKQLPKG